MDSFRDDDVGIVIRGLGQDIGVLDQQYQVRAFQSLAGPPYALRLDDVLGVANAGRIRNVHGYAIEIDRLPQHIARRAGDFRDDGGVLPRQGVQQARLARVGRPNDRQHDPIPQQAPLLSLLQQQAQIRPRPVEALQHVAFDQKVDFLFGEIDGRLDKHTQARELFLQGIDVP